MVERRKVVATIVTFTTWEHKGNVLNLSDLIENKFVVIDTLQLICNNKASYKDTTDFGNT